MQIIKFCKKRDGSIVAFEKNRISNAINKAFKESDEGNKFIAQMVTETVVEKIIRIFQNDIPAVEEIQDLVETTLMYYGFNRTAKQYILYRDNRNRSRITT